KSAAPPKAPTIESRIDTITVAFRTFVTSLGVDYKKSDSDLLDSILSFLLDLGGAWDADQPAKGGVGVSQEELSDRDRYLVARFVQNCYAHDPALAKDLQWIGSVGLLAELAEDFGKPQSRVKRARLTVFLDSPVALDLLGTSGKHAASLTRSLVEK